MISLVRKAFYCVMIRIVINSGWPPNCTLSRANSRFWQCATSITIARTITGDAGATTDSIRRLERCPPADRRV